MDKDEWAGFPEDIAQVMQEGRELRDFLSGFTKFRRDRVMEKQDADPVMQEFVRNLMREEDYLEY